MKKTKYLGYGLALALSIGFTGCGGGGGGDTVLPTPPATNTNKYDLRTFIDTTTYTIDGEGTMTSPIGTANLTGTIQSLYGGTVVAPSGETAHTHETTIILTAGTTTVTGSTISATYMGYIVSMLNITDDILCAIPLTLSSITPVPTDAQVGYISDVVPLECDDGSYITNVIRLDDAGGGNAELSIISNTYASQGGALQNSETDSIIVTPSMSMVNVEILGSNPPDAITYEFHSTSIVQN